MSSYRSLRKARIAVSAILLPTLLLACQRQPQVASDGAGSEQPAAAVAETPAAIADVQSEKLQDVIENTPSYVVGISYPTGLDDQPELSRLIRGYADAARADFQHSLAALGNERPTAPYELSLSFEKLLQTPQFLVIAADGSSYTGGAHSVPLLARFVWLAQPRKRLTAAELIPNKQGWETVSHYVAARLRESAEARAQADLLSSQEEAALLSTVDSMIDAGTSAQAENFSEFQPVLNAAGSISSLRFVFAPYQVGPYSDGVQSVDVPAALLRPLVAPEYTELFAQ